MFTKTFWLDLLERVIVTFAGALAAVLVMAGGLDSIDWGFSLGTAALAALISFLKGLAATRVGNPESAALLPTRQP